MKRLQEETVDYPKLTVIFSILTVRGVIFMEISEKAIQDMQRQVDACSSYIDALARNSCRSPEKVNTMLDAAMQKIELCCIELRRICEISRPASNPALFAQSSYYAKEIYGEVTLMDTGWLDIRLNALLPHCRFSGGTQYISDTITRLLKRFRDTGGELPFFQKAFLAIVEHRPVAGCGAFDQDNKGFKAVINSLKGRVFADDDQFELSLGLFTIQDEESCCHIYVTPSDAAGDFLYQMAEPF